TFSARRHRRHSGSDAELARLIAGSCDDTTFPRPANGDRLAPKFRIVSLLHRRIERVHVNVNDLPWPFLFQLQIAAPACRRKSLLPTIPIGVGHDDAASASASFTFLG